MSSIATFFEPATIFHVHWGDYVPALRDAVARTLEFTVVSFSVAMLFGFTLATMRGARLRVIRAPAAIYTELFKNLPALVPLFIIYYGLAGVGLELSGFVAGCAALGLFYASYFGEIFRGALQGISYRQKEAAQALGMSGRATLLRVIVPQALRLALPGMATMLVDLLKTTSLLVTISGAELMTNGQLITADTFRPLEVYIVIGAIYFCLCFPLSRLALLLEKYMAMGVPLAPRRRRLHKMVRSLIAE